MPNIECPFAGCDSVTKNEDKDIAIASFNAHIATHTCQAKSVISSSAESYARPKITQSMLEESWESFLVQWELYEDGTSMGEGEKVKQLIHCCEQDLLDMLLHVEPKIGSKTKNEVLGIIKQLAVVPVAMGVRRAKLFEMKQERGESLRKYAAKIQGKATTCAFIKKCSSATCTSENEYSEVITKYILINGLEDEEIKRETLGWNDLDSSNFSETIFHIEEKEMARDAMKMISSSRINSENQKSTAISQLKKTTTCVTCDKKIKKYVKNKQGKLLERKTCIECWRQKKETVEKNVQQRQRAKEATKKQQHTKKSVDDTCLKCGKV